MIKLKRKVKEKRQWCKIKIILNSEDENGPWTYLNYFLLLQARISLSKEEIVKIFLHTKRKCCRNAFLECLWYDILIIWRCTKWFLLNKHGKLILNKILNKLCKYTYGIIEKFWLVKSRVTLDVIPQYGYYNFYVFFSNIFYFN